MPYKTNADLPKAVQDALPAKAQDVFRNVANSVLENDGSDQSAFRQAWGALKNQGWEKQKDGTWIKPAKKSARENVRLDVNIDVKKSINYQQIVFGYASIIQKDDGSPVVDSQGDVIDEADLEEAVYDYVINSREAGTMHEVTKGVGTLIESFMVTQEKKDMLKLDMPIGWWVGYKVHSSEDFAKIASGEYPMFSIGGSAIREEIE